MGWNYNNLNYEFTKRRSGFNYKRLWRNIELTQGDDGTFHMEQIVHEWKRDDRGGFKRMRKDNVKFATMTKDNVLTFEYAERPDPTMCNRITELLGRATWSDMSHHRNKLTTVRIRSVKWNYTSQSYTPDPWHPKDVQPTDWVHGTIPFTPGMKFQMCGTTGEPLALLTEVKDIKVLVKTEAVQKAKADTKVLRTLVRAMARMGSFDEIIHKKMTGWYHTNVDLNEVNYKEPTGDDATKVFQFGAYRANRPDMQIYVKGTWYKRPEEEVRQSLIDACIDNGMRALRKVIYDTTDGYEKVVV